MNLKYPPKNIYFFIIVNASIIYLFSLIVSLFPFAESLHNPISDDLETNKIESLFLILFLGPLFETLIFQAAIISILRYTLSFIKGLGKRQINMISIIVSGLSFSAVHIFNITYAIIGFVVGLIFAFSYVYVKDNKKYPILVVFLIHSLTNLFTFIHNYLFKDL